MEAQRPARREVEIILKDKPYTVRELDIRAYGDCENFVKSNHIRLYRENSAGVDPDKVEDTVAKMIKSSYAPEELAAAMAAPSASEYVAYLSLRHNPGVTRESMADIVDMANIAEVNRIIAALQEDEADAEGEEADEDPTQADPENL